MAILAKLFVVMVSLLGLFAGLGELMGFRELGPISWSFARPVPQGVAIVLVVLALLSLVELAFGARSGAISGS